MITAYKYISDVMKLIRKKTDIRYFKNRIAGYQVKLSPYNLKIKTKFFLA